MSKVVGLVAGLSALISSALAQEIDMVTLRPNPDNGEMYANLPARPQGEKAETVIKNKAAVGGTLIQLPSASAEKVNIGDSISLSRKLESSLPASAYATLSQSDVNGLKREKSVLAQATGLQSVGSAVSPLTAAPTPALMSSLDSASPTVRVTTTQQLEKGDSYKKTYVQETVQAVSPRLTPRGTGLTTYARPAVDPQAGFIGPYGVGLAAAAPVGTPYLRSPAFAGPPIIYMPQTVTRVLLPGVTPYPANIMAPPIRYAYASAPFLRTDIYTDLPYGTFYWPQGYAGTTPVEPQVPAYLMAPASAVLTNEASYTTQRYAPGLANPETLSPITAANSSGAVSAVTIPGPQPSTVALIPEPAAAIARIPAVQPDSAAPIGSELSVATVTSSVESGSGLQPLSPFPSLTQPLIPLTGTDASASITGPAPLALTPAPTPRTEAVIIIPDSAPVSGLPQLTGVLPTTSLPDLGTVASPPPGTGADLGAGIVVDDKTPGYLIQNPPGAWEPSVNMSDSFQESSLIARVDGQPKTATFHADIPEDGEYEISMWWVASNKQFRSVAVPVTVHAASGSLKTSVDQTNNNKQFNSIGRFSLKAGQKVPVVTVSTENVESGPTVSVSLDAIKIVKVP